MQLVFNPFTCKLDFVENGGSAGVISITNLTSGTDNSGFTSVATASVTPSTNYLVLLSVHSRTGITEDPNQPTATGCDLTWEVVNSIVYDTTSSSRRRLTLFRAMGIPSAGVVTIDFGGQSQTEAAWSIEQVSGVDTSGTNGSGAVVQSATNKDETLTSDTLTVTLDAFESPNNGTFGCFGDADNTHTVTPGSGFTELVEVATAASIFETQWRSDNSISVDWTSSGTIQGGGIGIEIKASGSASQVQTIIGGTDITIDSTDPANPIVNFSGIDGHTIQDEGTPLTQRTNLNFIGDSVTVTDNSGTDSTDVTITGGGGVPASPDTSVQFNDGGSFGGIDVLTWDGNNLERTSQNDALQYVEIVSEESIGDVLGWVIQAFNNSPNTRGFDFRIKAADGNGSGQDGGDFLVSAGHRYGGGIPGKFKIQFPSNDDWKANILAENNFTSDRDFTFPDKSGTFALLDDVTSDLNISFSRTMMFMGA